MFTELMASGSGGGGMENKIWIGIFHKNVDTGTIYTCIITPTISNNGTITFGWDDATEVSHSATNYGSVFDFTISVSSSKSVRLYSTTMSGAIYADIILNGTTIESGILVMDGLNKSYPYKYVFAIS